MKTRYKISIFLVVLGLISLVLPEKDNNVRRPVYAELLETILSDTIEYSPDEVAKFMVNEDTTIQLIDVRNREEFLDFNIPGAINIPFESLFDESYRGFLDQDQKRNILYSNGDILSNRAVALLYLEGFRDNYVMKGGMNAWYENIMLSEFKGDRITPRENALFETRYRARKHFTRMNSLPDSLKMKYLEIKKEKEMELRGGCE